ncbi:hypothetical protein BKA58DRAFT_398509 [Alternaria rosae]|uniref:uncharacterized protein n=1 Tax=Alternaria rosae TaxID=1187941 RepID=UPI001E8D6E5C|nr:uncharacterized protein BKA58DRAFT_398509 [Alternaria rosae]KAH6878462.1 hypothetical protein BKA58DRAFT_398509 [Alternaria rosae]
MPVVRRVSIPFNGTDQGNATFTPPGSYAQPIEGENIWWKYMSGAILLIVGIGGFIIAVYLCVGKRRKERAERASRNAPAVGRPPNAPVEPGNDNELAVIARDPPQPHEAPDDATGVQQAHDEPNEPVLEGPEGLGPDMVGHGHAAGGASVEQDAAAAGGVA